jgi:hypothetical protein
MYARLKRISIDAKVLKVYEVENSDTEIRLTIFNSWMITRNIETHAVGAFERDYTDGSWNAVEPAGIFSDIPIWPIQNLRQGVAGSAKKRLLDKLYAAANYKDVNTRLVDQRTEEANRLKRDEGMEHNAAFELASERFPQSDRLMVARNAFANRLFGSQFSKGKRKPPKGFVSHQSVYNALKGLRAEFFRQFRDAELFRAILSMDHKSMTLGDYLYFASNREAVLKVWGERRNLMPMLPYIGRRYWGGDELFSNANWTNPAGLVTAPDFTASHAHALPSQNVGGGVFSPFPSARAYQWLARSKNTVVKAWARNRKDPRVADLMAELNLPKDTAVLVIANIVVEMANALVKLDQCDFQVGEYRQRVLRTFRAYAVRWAGVRKERGYRPMIAALTYENDGTSGVFDYLTYEGFAQDLPARNATWASIVRRSDDWHDHDAQRYRRQALPYAVVDYEDDSFKVGNEDLPRKWSSLVPEQSILDCRVRPLGKHEEVVIEGEEMAHCVGSYTSRCARDRYRVYSITEPNGTRSTLGINLLAGSAIFDQVQGQGNSRPSELVRRVAEKVVAMYVTAMAAEGVSDLKAA